MKKVLFSIFLFSALALGVQAQKSSCTNSKSCTAKPAAACESKSTTSATGVNGDAAAKLASMDATIEAKTCPVTGTVSYVRKETSTNGTVSYVDVSYDATTNSFVNVAPSTMQGHEGCGAKGTSASGKSCCAGGAKSTSGTKSCCAEKGKQTSTTSTTTNSSTTVKTSSPSKG